MIVIPLPPRDVGTPGARISADTGRATAAGGLWFVWRGERIAWNVKAIAEEIGLDRVRLGFAAGLYPLALDLFWTGAAKFVFVETLARLAAALTTMDRPFDLGEVFVKAED